MNPTSSLLLLVEDDDDHADLFRRSVELLEEPQFNLRHVTTISHAQRELSDNDIDVVVLDYRLGLDSGLVLLRAMREAGDRRPVIVLTGQGNEYVAVEMMRAGASDYVVKSDVNPVLLRKVLQRAIDSGRRNDLESEQLVNIQKRLATLTPRERDVMRLVVAGMTTQQIGRRLHRSANTVKIHRINIMRKMQANTPADLARMVTSLGCVDAVAAARAN